MVRIPFSQPGNDLEGEIEERKPSRVMLAAPRGDHRLEAAIRQLNRKTYYSLVLLSGRPFLSRRDFFFFFFFFVVDHVFTPSRSSSSLSHKVSFETI